MPSFFNLITCSNSVSDTVDRNDICDSLLVNLGLLPEPLAIGMPCGGHAGFITTFVVEVVGGPGGCPSPSIFSHTEIKR